MAEWTGWVFIEGDDLHPQGNRRTVASGTPHIRIRRTLTERIARGTFPPMKAVRADTKRRVVIPGARPGDIFDVHRQGDERFVLVRLHRPAEAPGMTREACLEAMSKSPLSPTLSWEQLRGITREP